MKIERVTTNSGAHEYVIFLSAQEMEDVVKGIAPNDTLSAIQENYLGGRVYRSS